MNKFPKLAFILLIFLGCSVSNHDFQEKENRTSELEIPSRDKLWIFMMAGQSNMAGRGKIEPQDKILNDRILTINSENEIVVAKEPLHFYEPSGAGLDCGISFGTEMLRQVPEDISLLLVPTAVGGSSIEQWIHDEEHRGVILLSNFQRRMKAALEHGVLKGVLWHQGEADAHHADKIQSYRENMETLFTKFRRIAIHDSLPIVVGKLGAYSVNQESWDQINTSIETYVLSDEYAEIVETSDLEDRGDKIHFNSAAQRTLGKRYAATILTLIN